MHCALQGAIVRVCICVGGGSKCTRLGKRVLKGLSGTYVWVNLLIGVSLTLCVLLTSVSQSNIQHIARAINISEIAACAGMGIHAEGLLPHCLKIHGRGEEMAVLIAIDRRAPRGQSCFIGAPLQCVSVIAGTHRVFFPK